MVKHYAKLILRAFNAESEAAEKKQQEREEQCEEKRVQKELQRGKRRAEPSPTLL